MNKDLRKVVILLAHPNIKGSQANKALIDAVSDIEGVAVFNLYELSEDIAFNVDEWSKNHLRRFGRYLPVSFLLDVCPVITKKMAGRSVHSLVQDSGCRGQTVNDSNDHRLRIRCLS